MRYNGKDLQNLREAVMHQISEDAQPFENLVEQKRKFDARDHSSRVNVTFVADADQRSYENITRDPALKKLPGFLGLGRTIFHSRKGKAEFTFRAANSTSKVGMNEKDEGKFKKLLKKHGLKLVDTIYEGSKKLDELSRRRLTAIRISVRDTLEKANIPFDIHELKKEIRVPQKFFTKAKKELDKTFGGNLENKTGFKVVAGLVESVHLEEKKLPTARKIVSGLGDADGPFTVVVMKNNKVIHQESTKFAKMLPAIVKELAEKMPNTTIAIENKTGQIVKVFKRFMGTYKMKSFTK